ncbi:MAG: hypothetical protein ABL933_01565 [Methyloglobulus sp.]|nr:hypothetical protein [Methyloglobulus sp.]
MLIGANVAVAAVPALFFEQSTSITAASDTLKASRVPVRPATGAIKYYDIEFKFQVDATGAPILAPLYPVVSLSPALLSGAFKAGDYKDSAGNGIFTVTGPGASTGGRTNWSIVRKTASGFIGSWTTGPIVGHPLQAVLTSQHITSTIYSWGTAGGNLSTSIYGCMSGGANRLAVGFVQIGNQLALHGFCTAGSAVENGQMILSLCTVANPCP